MVAKQETIRALVVDDSLVALRAICAMLRSRGTISVVGTARNGRDAVSKASSLRPDLILMDMEMPGLKGLEATSRVRKRFPAIRIIVVTSTTARKCKRRVKLRMLMDLFRRVAYMQNCFPK